MKRKATVVGYARISYDEDKENYESIINQSNIIRDYAAQHLNAEISHIFEDDNWSGYKFNRPSFNEMKKMALNGEVNVIVAKDLSRIGRHNARTLLFIEEMEEMNVRVIAINDSIDTAENGSDITLGVKTWYNELYVKDISRKIKSTIQNKQKNASWICAVPYGYVMTDYKSRAFEIDEPAAEIVRRIFDMYISGYGYKKIANTLTDEKIPTPRMREKAMKEGRGEPCRLSAKEEWSIISVSEILKNDFYIGTLRTGKYTRKGINGKDIKVGEERHNVFEGHHAPIIGKEAFFTAKELLIKRSKNNYRGIKKYENNYSGLLFCGECGSPMFSISNPKRPKGYVCGAYQKRGRKACTAHHIHEATLDRLVKCYIQQVYENAFRFINELNNDVKAAQSTEKSERTENLAALLKKELETAKSEQKAIKMQMIREIAKNPENTAEIEELYSELEKEARDKAEGLKNQLEYAEKSDRNKQTLKQSGKDALQIFDGILKKTALSKRDVELVTSKITVYEDRAFVELRADVSQLLCIDKNDCREVEIVQRIWRHKDKVLRCSVEHSNVFSEGDPLEIFTDREGEIILKKYSPIGELGTFAKEYAESLSQSLGHIICIVDKDQVIAVSGAAKKDFMEKHLSPQMEKCLNNRITHIATRNDSNFVPLLENDVENAYNSELITPIISEGDVLGAIVFLSNDKKMGEVEGKLAQTAAGFIGKQMEQ